MTNLDSTANSPEPMSLAARIGWGALIVATLAACYFSNLGAIGFVGPDEPRYAWIARDMTETGDWVTPRLYGKPWFEKPVLYYWMASTSFKLFGVSEAAARLPSAISALLATLALAWLAWRVYGEEIARWLLLLLPTSVGMISFSHAAATDMPFSAMLTIAMVCAAVVLGLTRNERTPILPRTPWIALLLFGFFLGLAVLAKGPAAIILCGGAVFLWALFTKKWRDAFRLLHPVALFSFCVTALPWYILCAHRNPDFFRVFIIEHNFKRYLTPEFQHIQPFWYYAPILLVAFLPWTVSFGWITFAKRFGLSREGRSDHLQLLFWIGALFCFVFFSTSKSKLPGYILPAIFYFGFVFSREFFVLASQKKRNAYWIMLSGGILLGLSALFIGSVLRQPSPLRQLISESIAALLVCLALPTLAIAGFLRRSTNPMDGSRARLMASVLFWILFALAGFVLPEIDQTISSRSLAREILERQAIKVDQIRAYHLPRARAYQLNFYLHTELREFTFGDKDAKYVICSLETAQVLSQSGVRINRYIFGSGITQEANLYEVVPVTSADGPASGGKMR
jgi:4-amino-4-deoxy-L-arabinose transferase-like glycosyltransferase